MLCDICKKNEATIHIKEMHNNQWKSINLCAECAKLNESAITPPELDITNMLLNITKAVKKKSGSPQKSAAATEQQSAKSVQMMHCPVCNWSQEDIRKNNGKLGCPSCYKSFSTVLNQVLSDIQKGTVHIGKKAENAGKPDKMTYNYQLSTLEKRLASHIANEEYEDAAKVRDAIRDLKEQFRQTAGENDDE